MTFGRKRNITKEMASKSLGTLVIPDIILDRKKALKNSTSLFVADSYRGYAIYVNSARQIPSLPDGLKGVQRIAMWCMKPNKSVKTMGLAGQMISSLLYLHGDQSAGDAISRLAAPYLNNLPLLKGEGGFGTLLKPDKYSSPRYTAVAKPKYLDQLLYTDSDIVPMVPNYDGSTHMPAHFLPLIPLVLLNGAWGRGVGYACNVFPRRFEDLVAATALAVEGKPIPPELLRPVFEFNDDAGTFVEYDSNGNPRWEFRGKLNIVNTSTVEITALPSVNITHEEFKEFLNELEDKGAINSWEDYSTKTIRIVVKLPRGQAKDWSEEDGLKFFKLVKTSGEQLTVVGANGFSIKEYRYEPEDKYPDPVERLVRDWAAWRFTFMARRYEKLIEQTTDRLDYLRVLLACFKERLPDHFLTVKNKAELREKIVAAGVKHRITVDDFDDISERIADRASYSWTQDAHAKVISDISDEEALLARYEDLLASPVKQKNVLKREISDLGKIKT